MAAFVSKSSVWILSIYSSFFSHYKHINRHKVHEVLCVHDTYCDTQDISNTASTAGIPELHILTVTAEDSSFLPDFVLQREEKVKIQSLILNRPCKEDFHHGVHLSRDLAGEFGSTFATCHNKPVH